MAYVDRSTSSRQLPAIAGVAVVHALIGYAFVSGLAMNVIHTVVPVFTVASIADTPPPPPIPQPRPLPKAQPSQERVTTVRPAFDTGPAQTALVLPPEIPHVDVAPATVIETPPVRPASKAAGPRVKGERAGWITTEDYPSASIRAGEAGTVGIAVTVGTDGRVSGCTVTASSGHPALDATACRLYERRARFAPALDDAGNPVAAPYPDPIRWELPGQ